MYVCQMSGDDSVSAFPDGDSLFYWKASITGGLGTVYEGQKYKLSLSFPPGYPFTAPTVKFITPCYHPNVDTHGNICLDILKVSIFISRIFLGVCFLPHCFV